MSIVPRMSYQLLKTFIIKPRSVELQCHVFVEGRRKNLMSRCSNSSPRYSVRTTMPSLLILKISYVFNNKISITLLSFLICLGRSFPNPNTKVMKSCDNHLCCNRFICRPCKIGILRFHAQVFPCVCSAPTFELLLHGVKFVRNPCYACGCRPQAGMLFAGCEKRRRRENGKRSGAYYE